MIAKRSAKPRECDRPGRSNAPLAPESQRDSNQLAQGCELASYPG